MANLFEGLEDLGLQGMNDMKLFEDEKAKQAAQKKVEVHKEIAEEDFLFDKTYMCPICDRQFTAKSVMTGKAKFKHNDFDLRPIYQGIDPLKYDGITCRFCGYSALNRYFTVNPTTGQLRLIKEGLKTFKGIPEHEGKYTYDDAIIRLRLALACAVIKKAKPSEKAFICLKTAWLFRGKNEELMRLNPVNQEEIDENKKQEKVFIENAYDGFVEAFAKENFPMCGMDEMTVTFLAANLAFELEKYDESLRLLERIIISREANSSIKSKATDLKEEIYKKKGKEA